MTLTLVLALLSGQVIYEWVDAKGQSHFTDDRSTIPRGVKPRETKGAEVSVITAAEAPAEASSDAGVEDEETQATDACTVAREDLARAEEQASAAQASQALLEEDATLRCGQVLLTHGQGSFAQCMAGRSEALTRDHSALQQQVEVARETLKVAEAQGCR
jgi:hypothetical protein